MKQTNDQIRPMELICSESFEITADDLRQLLLLKYPDLRKYDSQYEFIITVALPIEPEWEGEGLVYITNEQTISATVSTTSTSLEEDSDV